MNKSKPSRTAKYGVEYFVGATKSEMIGGWIEMKTEDLGNSKILNLLFKPSGILMGSKLRKWIMNPVKTLRGADIQSGQNILEVGCGTGFFIFMQYSRSCSVKTRFRNLSF